MLRSSAWSSLHIFQLKYCTNFSSNASCLPRPSHSSWLGHPSIWCNVELMKLPIVRILRLSATSSLLGTKILLSTLISPVRHQVSHPYKTMGTLVGLCNVKIRVLDIWREDSELNGSKHSRNLICSSFICELNYDLLKVALRLMVSQSVCPSWHWAPLGLTARFLLWLRQLRYLMSWSAFPDGGTGLSCNTSQSLCW